MLHLDSLPYVQTARDAVETSVQSRNLGEVFSCHIYLYNQHFPVHVLYAIPSTHWGHFLDGCRLPVKAAA